MRIVVKEYKIMISRQLVMYLVFSVVIFFVVNVIVS